MLQADFVRDNDVFAGQHLQVVYSTYMTPKKELFVRARTFQDSLEAAYKQDHPAGDHKRWEPRMPCTRVLELRPAGPYTISYMPQPQK